MRLLTRLHVLLTLWPVVFCAVCVAQEKPQFNTASAGVQAADVASAVGLLCSAKNLTHGKDGHVNGCRVCPVETGFAGENGGELDIDAQTSGHFTSTQADNLILGTGGCEPHANNFGGSYIFSIDAGKVRLVQYNPGFMTDQCHKFAFADGRNYLICRGGWAGQGEVDSDVSMVTFTAAGKGVSTTLLSLQNTTGECGGPDATARESEVKSIRFTPADAAQITGLTIIATLGTVSCANVEEPEKSKAAGKAPAVKTYDVEFVFDGKGYRATPASRAAVERLTPKD